MDRWFLAATLAMAPLAVFRNQRIGGAIALAAPLVFVTKSLSEIAGFVPPVRASNRLDLEGLYYSLVMSTGHTFGTISTLFSRNHGVINQSEYSHLQAPAVIGRAAILTVIANAIHMRNHVQQAKGRQLSEAGSMRPVGDRES